MDRRVGAMGDGLLVLAAPPGPLLLAESPFQLSSFPPTHPPTGMRAYFIRRFLLIPPTLFGISILLFVITRIVPGGPLERAIMEMQAMDAMSGRSVQTSGQGMAISEAQMEKLKAYYGFDQPIHLSYLQWLGKVLRGNLGESYRFNEPVWDVIRQRFPISIFYGVLTLIITYSVCIPLGIVKAIRHRQFIDNSTSILIFMGYAVPGYALGALLILFFSIQNSWFPTGGFTSLGFHSLSLWGKVIDVLHHAALPLACYLVGSFAITTMLMKNHLMDNLSADYMRTAVAKGVAFKQAVTRHALRNSLIPIATTFGQNITLLVGGAFLIEFIFDIDGFGLLGLDSILNRDYPVVIGVTLLSTFLLLLGNIISDILVALIDPRIRFS